MTAMGSEAICTKSNGASFGMGMWTFGTVFVKRDK